MNTTIMIIENSETDFNLVKKILVGPFYTVLPDKIDEMKCCIDAGNNKLIDYVLQHIDDNYRELRLIVCDIRLNNSDASGQRVVESIRKHRIPSFPIWTSLVPIIAITGHAVRQEHIITAGADYSIHKERIKKDQDYFLALVRQQIISFEGRLESMYPDELKERIKLFKNNHQDRKTAFIMTSFAEEHQETISQIISVLEERGIKPYLANKQGGENYEFLWPNIEVFIHGCDFGIGIYADDSILMGCKDNKKIHYKRIRINPNMSQEVGYMLGLQKKVCILKDKKLDKLPTDLAGMIYVEYDNEEDLKKKLGEWISNKVLF